ncbi:MAG: hypothetical protein HQ507_03670 [Candidatus Marinimicrobia bacterium]|nr:hypothetical protein [Candidatus Neomarinimicrobiota bacterium]
MTRLFQKYRRIAKRISPMDIATNFDQLELSWDDLFSTGSPSNSSGLFLGKYSKDGIKFIIERFGLDRQARRLGFRNLSVSVNTTDPYRHKLTIYDGPDQNRDHIIMEFVARYQQLIPKDVDAEFLSHQPLKVLMIEWLLLQNPKSNFTTSKPRLPGQFHPGLGLGDELMALFTIMGRHLQVDGIVNVPEYYHTALLFSKRFVFLSPHVQADVTKVAQDLWKKYRLAVIAWASATGCIIRVKSGEPFEWQPRKQIIPLQKELRSYFKSDAYLSISKKLVDERQFIIDEEKLNAALSSMKEPPFQL